MTSTGLNLGMRELGVDTSGDLDDIFNRYEDTRIPNTTSAGVRNYKCPRCGGEFNSWETKYYKYDGDGNRREAVTRTGFGIDHCPFCGLEKMKYNEDSDENTN